MKKISVLLFTVIISMFAIATVSAQPGESAKPKGDETKPKADDAKKETPVGVKWEVVISAPGQDYAGVLRIEKSGDKFTGSLMTELGEAPLANIKVEGEAFSASITVNAMGQTIDGTMSGKVKEGKISGDMNLSGLGTIPYTGKKGS